MRHLRFIPEGGALVEATCRTLHGRFLLEPSPRLNEITLGILARAQRKYEVRCYAFAFLSNHYHLLLGVENVQQLARFMGYLNSKLAREAGRLANWREKFWSTRYSAILITNEERAQVARLKYVLAQGCKEGLVKRPEDWPGAHAARSLVGLEELNGIWIDRTKEVIARRKGRACEADRFTTSETVHLTPLPAWSHLSAESYRTRIQEVLDEIAEEARISDTAENISLGSPADESLAPHELPLEKKRRTAPFCHAATQDARRALEAAYAWFYSAFRDAAEKLRQGQPAKFPKGCFPPALPFVAH
jgi:putative transposase